MYLTSSEMELPMKRIIDGQTYNTGTAAEIVGGENFNSSAWWGLYRTRAGAFFKVVINHDGEEVLFFDRLSDEDAAKLVANTLQIFSSNTLAECFQRAEVRRSK